MASSETHTQGNAQNEEKILWKMGSKMRETFSLLVKIGRFILNCTIYLYSYSRESQLISLAEKTRKTWTFHPTDAVMYENTNMRWILMWNLRFDVAKTVQRALKRMRGRKFSDLEIFRSFFGISHLAAAYAHLFVVWLIHNFINVLCSTWCTVYSKSALTAVCFWFFPFAYSISPGFPLDRL